MKNNTIVVSKPALFMLLGTLILGSSLARAEEVKFTGLYSGVYYSGATDEFKPDVGSTLTEKPGHLKIKLGKQLNDWAAIEGQGGITSNSDETQGIITLGGYFRANYELDDIYLYGLLGFSVIASYDDDRDNVDESGTSFGVGMELFGSKDLSLTFEYISMIDKSVDGGDPAFGEGDLSFETLGIGFTYYFTEDASPYTPNRGRIGSQRY